LKKKANREYSFDNKRNRDRSDRRTRSAARTNNKKKISFYREKERDDSNDQRKRYPLRPQSRVIYV